MVPDPALFVSDLLTPLSMEQIIEASAGGYSIIMGADPEPQCLAVIVAQICLETGNGRALHRFGVGNVKWSPDWEGRFTMYRCSEIIGGRTVWFDPPGHIEDGFLAAAAFRAFLTAEEGCAEQVRFLATRDRYRAAWHQIFQGRADAAVRALAQAGYFTAKVDAYAKAVTLIYGHVLEPCARILDGRSHGIDADLVARVESLVLEPLYDPALRDLRLHEDLAA